jgi:tripartite-type tricarboxylate transporter receptor subunit TctC
MKAIWEEAMSMFSRTPVRAMMALFALSGFATAAPAQTYPDKPITIVVHLAAGGGLDATTRVIAEAMGKELGQPLVVENRTGGGGAIATQHVARAAADGYTLQMANASTHAAGPAVNPNMGYDPVKDFVCVSFVGDSTNVAVVPANLDVKTLADFIALAKSKPGELNYTSGSTGSGSSQHLQGELFKKVTGIDLVHIPYEGAAPGLQAVISGEVQFFLAGTASAITHIQSGSLKALGISGLERSPLLPDVPTFAELGVAGFEVGPWYALIAPKGVSPDIVDKLNAAVVKALGQDEVKKRLAGLGVNIAGTSAQECTRIIEKEVEQWSTLAKELGFQASK